MNNVQVITAQRNQRCLINRLPSDCRSLHPYCRWSLQLGRGKRLRLHQCNLQFLNESPSRCFRLLL